MKKTVLLVVDVQTALIEYGMYKSEKMVEVINKMIDRCREKGIEVIFVRHNGGKNSGLEFGKPEWEIYEKIKIKAEDKIFDKKFNSAFKDTGLNDYLKSKKVERIILTGLQIDYCIDATCKGAFEYGYELVIPEDSVSTCDNGRFKAEDICDFFINNIWKNRFAKILKLEEIEL